MFKIDVEKKLGSLLIKCNFEMDFAGITAICGSSGAGKTSVINMTAGLITPDKGIISYNGKEFYNSEKHINLPANKRFTGYVFQESRLFPNMSVKKNLLYGADRKSNNSLNCSLDEVCGLLGITHLLDRYPQNLSGGEKQRVAIGRALLSNPEILLMDEPLASLDDSRKSELISYINIIQKHYNIPILYVSHSIDEILQLSDNALFMEQGISKYFGRTVEVLNKASIKVSSNESYNTIFEGNIEEYNSESSTALIRFGAGIVEAACENVSLGRKIRFSINIHDVVLSTKKPEGISIRNIYAGTVCDIIKQPNNIYDVAVDIGDIIWARISHGAYIELNISKGINIFVMIKSAAVSDTLKLVH